MSPSVGADRIAVQQDFGDGMDLSRRPELVSSNGLVSAVNGLYDDVGVVYRRGGSSMRSLSRLGTTPPTFLWDGWLSAGQGTFLATAHEFGRLETNRTITNLSGVGVPAPTRAAALDGTLFIPGGVTYDGSSLGTATTNAPFYATVASRLLTAEGDRVGFSAFGDPTTVASTDFWLIPGGVQITGLEGLRDSAAVFTTDGIWMISNLHLNLTDADGNLQQRLDRYSSDVVLWGNAGIAAWQGALVVPAVDGVWLLSLGVTSEAPAPFVPISKDIRPLYQDYVRRGYRPGLATVYRSHYLLPILNGSSVVDTLVCRLDARRDKDGQPPWSRLTGMAARCSALAVHKEPGDQQPTLIGVCADNGRVLNLSYLEPGSGAPVDADGSTFPFDVLLRAIPTGSLNKNTVTKLRVTYQLQGGPSTIEVTSPTEWGGFDWGEADWSTSAQSTQFAAPTLQAYQLEGHPVAGVAEWGLFDWGTKDWSSGSTETQLDGDAPLDPYGVNPFTWSVRKRTRFAQFRLRCDGNVAAVQLKSVELFGRSNRRL